MKNFNKKILISVFIFLIVLLLGISIIIANNTSNGVSSEYKEKIYHQIRYLDSTIIDMSNTLNNLNKNSSKVYINWEELQTTIEPLYRYWNSIILDLNNLEIENNHLTDFGKILDNINLSIKSKDKQSSLENLTKLYNKLVIYAQNLEYNEAYTNVVCTKYYLLTAYSIAEKGNWTNVHELILNADSYLLNVVNSMESGKYNQYNINQAYVAVKEMENLINVKDLDIFYLKYKIAMEKLEGL